MNKGLPVNNRLPGPTPYPPQVVEAMQRQPINHKGHEFKKLFSSIIERLQKVFATENDLLVFPASGTGGLEVSIVNCLSPGDVVIAASIGFFGDRFAAVAKGHGARVVLFQKPWGEALHPDELEEVLERNRRCKAVLLTHHETSTGVVNDIRGLARVARKSGKLVFVDAVSSLGAIRIDTDEWGLDVVATASQKGLMAPAGLTIVSVSPRAWRAHETAKMGRYYFDIDRAEEAFAQKQTPSTPAISALFGLDASLDLILNEGLENVFARHRDLAERFRRDAASAGWRIFPRDLSSASDAMTALKVPERVDGDALVDRLEKDYRIVVGKGMKEFAGKIIRVAHMGYVSRKDMDDVVNALRGIR